MNSDQKIVESILKMGTIAVVGISANSQRPSNYVSDYMKKNGYKSFQLILSMITYLMKQVFQIY